ncbi:MAG TPA: hypothetical protein VK689_18020 [Armatimonadota bacterium]|nr:hypothetical protein [Armatimonadota bacterium]
MQRCFYRPIATLLTLALAAAASAGAAVEEKITHSFLATGPATYIVGGDGKIVWEYPQGSRDGWVLPNGNVLLAVSSPTGGGVVEVTRDKKVVLEYQGTQKEVDTVQRLRNGNTLLSEAGPSPRLLELDSNGKVVKEVPLTSQLSDTHMQQRMSRKLRNGNYLVPHLLDRVVKEYTPEGKVVWEAKTPHMPFTAIRLRDGNTLIGCTHGNLVIEVDPKGEIVWRVDNDDLPGRPLNDTCGVQRLPNGNTVITSYHVKANETKLTEITRDKKIVWTYTDDKPHGIHHFQILDTNGKPLEGRPLR